MSWEEKRILEALRSGRFVLSVHAAQRMYQRSITEADLRACGRTASTCMYQVDKATWRVDGEDLDGNPFTVVCAFDTVLVIVTIF